MCVCLCARVHVCAYKQVCMYYACGRVIYQMSISDDCVSRRASVISEK